MNIAVDEVLRPHLGKPFEFKALGPDALDCRALPMMVYDDLSDPHDGDVDDWQSKFDRVDDGGVRTGDVLLWATSDAGGIRKHLAVVADDASFAWTALEEVGVVRVPISRLAAPQPRVYRRKC